MVLPSGRFLALGTLALMMPDRLAEEIEGLDLATVIAIDPEFGAIREAMAAADAKNLEAVAIDPATVRARLADPQTRQDNRASATTTWTTSASRAWSGRFDPCCSRCSPTR